MSPYKFIVLLLLFTFRLGAQAPTSVQAYVQATLTKGHMRDQVRLDALHLAPWLALSADGWLHYPNNHLLIWVRFDAQTYRQQFAPQPEPQFIYFGNRYSEVMEYQLDAQGVLHPKPAAADWRPSPFHFLIQEPKVYYFAIRPSAYRTRLTDIVLQTNAQWETTQYQFVRKNQVQIILWYAIIAMLAFATFLSFTQYFVLRGKNGFLFYALFLCTQLFNFYSHRLDFLFEPTTVLNVITTHGNQISTYLGHAFYFYYACNFLHLEIYAPKLRRFLHRITYVLFACFVLHFILFYGFERQDFASKLYLGARIVLAITVFLSLCFLAFKNIEYKIFFLVGTVLVFCVSLFWLWFGVNKLPDGYFPIHPGLLYYLAILVQALIFLTGLSYRLKDTEAQKQSALKQLATDRARISRDLHDHMASELTAYSVQIRSFLAQNRPDHPENKALSTGLNELNENMRNIIWMTNDEPRNLSDIYFKIQDYLHNTNSPIAKRISVDLDTNADQYLLSPKLKYDIFLILKESLNNTMKYANATAVRVTIQKMPDGLHLKVTDNGIGFDPKTSPMGNGLRNLKTRAEEHHGKFTVTSAPQKGTTIHILIPNLKSEHA
jgi:signal transduction histidine kinase